MRDNMTINEQVLDFVENHKKWDREPMISRIRRFDKLYNTNVHDEVEQILVNNDLKEFAAGVYLYVYPETDLVCKYSGMRRYTGFRDGFACNQKCECVRERFEGTMQERYGVSHALQSDQITEKFKSTLMERYGSDNLYESFKEERKDTNLRKYGAETPLEVEGVLARTRDTYSLRHGSNTPFENPEYQREIQKQWSEINKGGQRGFMRPIEDPDIRYKRMFGEHHEILSDPLRLSELLESNTRTQVSDVIGCSVSLIDKLVKEYNLTDYMGEPSYYEVVICKYLDELGVEYRTGDRKIIAPKEIDIVLDDYKLGIEVNGLYWHSENFGGKDRHYHLNKTMNANSAGYDLLHITQDEWDNSSAIIKSIIKSRLGLSDRRIYARKCQVVEIDARDARDFLKGNHLQGHTIGCFMNLGLIYDGELVSVMTFKYNRGVVELSRFVNKINTNVVGGASRLFKSALKSITEDITTYSDARYFNGDIYGELGFEFIGMTQPGYYYFNSGNKKYDRTHFQKHKLASKLEKYDPNKSAWENMKDNGFDRIWNCGHRKFIYQNN